MTTQENKSQPWTVLRPGTKPAPAESKAPLVTTLSALRGRKSGARTTRRRKARGPRSRVPSLPQRLELVNTVDVVRRFLVATTTQSTPITRTSFASTLGGIVTTANTTVTLWTGTFKIRSIVAWPAAGTQFHIDTQISGSAEQALVKDSVKNETLPTGTTLDRPVVWKPVAGTYLDMWQSPATNGSDQLFSLTATAGGVVDVHSTFTLCGVVAASGVTTTSTYAVGSVVYMDLDTGNKFQIIGLNGARH